MIIAQTFQAGVKYQLTYTFFGSIMKDSSRLALINVTLFSLFWALQIIVSKLGFNAGAKAVPFTLQSAFVALIVLAIIVLPKI